MDPNYVCFKSIQGKDTLLPEQKNRVQSLTETVRQLVNITPVNVVDIILLAEIKDVVTQQVQD